MEPSTIKATFYMNPEKLALFLNQVRAYMDRYGSTYFDDVACMNVIIVNLEGEEAEWVKSLHYESVLT